MAQNKIIKNIPNSEKISVNYVNETGEKVFILCEKLMAIPKEFILYKIEKDGTYSLLGKGNIPEKLEEKFIYKEKKEKVKKK